MFTSYSGVIFKTLYTLGSAEYVRRALHHLDPTHEVFTSYILLT